MRTSNPYLKEEEKGGKWERGDYTIQNIVCLQSSPSGRREER
jgi:hypothetical protein